MAHRGVAKVLYAAAAACLGVGLVVAAVELVRVKTLREDRLRAVVGLFGASAMCLGAGQAVRILPHALRGRVAVGRVARIVPGGEGGEDAVVRYSVGSVCYEFAAAVRSGARAGDEVRVVYPPADPGDGRVGGWRLGLSPVVLIVLGGLFVCVWAIPPSWPPGMDPPDWQ